MPQRSFALMEVVLSGWDNHGQNLKTSRKSCGGTSSKISLEHKIQEYNSCLKNKIMYVFIRINSYHKNIFLITGIYFLLQEMFSFRENKLSCCKNNFFVKQ